MIPCPDQKPRENEPNADGWICTNSEAIASLKHGGRPSAGICERCRFRPHPIPEAELVKVAEQAKSRRLTLQQIQDRISQHLPICDNCRAFDSVVSGATVRCDESPRKCGCVNIALEDCPLKRFRNGRQSTA